MPRVRSRGGVRRRYRVLGPRCPKDKKSCPLFTQRGSLPPLGEVVQTEDPGVNWYGNLSAHPKSDLGSQLNVVDLENSTGEVWILIRFVNQCMILQPAASHWKALECVSTGGG